MYGKGVYFARDAAYSANPTYAEPDTRGHQYIMACRIVIGEYCAGRKDALTPDIRDPKSHLLYDSTVGLLGNDTMSTPSIFVTYHGKSCLCIRCEDIYDVKEEANRLTPITSRRCL